MSAWSHLGGTALTLALSCGCGGGSSQQQPPPPQTGQADPIISSGFESPVGTPYSRREHFEQLGLLQSNGFSAARESWRTVAVTSSPLLRAAACALLAEAPSAEDRPALLTASKDPSALVRVWAALALARLGEKESVQALRAIATEPVDATEPAPLAAAAALARVGDLSGLPLLTRAMNDDDLRLEATRRLIDVARLDVNATLPLFARALRDPSEVVRSLAMAQLEELRASVTRPLLEELVSHGSGDELERAHAQKILASLPP